MDVRQQLRGRAYASIEVHHEAWLNVSEAAEYAGVSRDTIYTACERGELRRSRVSGRIGDTQNGAAS
jgi:excisionase family DNA binding protein